MLFRRFHRGSGGLATILALVARWPRVGMPARSGSRTRTGGARGAAGERRRGGLREYFGP